MFSEEMMKKLETLQPSNIDKTVVEKYVSYSCDCTGGCTDNCYDCAKNSGNQW